MRIRPCSALLSLGLVVIGACDAVDAVLPPTSTAPEPDRNIVYVGTVGTTTDIFTIHETTRALPPFNVTNDVAPDNTPSWSKDGKTILFSSARDGNAEIYTIKEDGTSPQRLTNNPSADYSPAYSPDESKIVFVREVTGGRPQLFVMNSNGTNVVNISNNTFNESQPSWSPDGRKIAYASDRDAKFGANTYLEIYTMNPDGTGVTRLTFHDTGIDYYPSWSPDGTQIAFTTSRTTNPPQCYAFALEIWIMNADGSSPRREINDCYGNANASWSADGEYLILQSDRGSPNVPYKWDVWYARVHQDHIAFRETFIGAAVVPKWRRLRN